VSAATGLHKSTAHRILMALEYNGLVEQNQETAKYRLGIKGSSNSANRLSRGSICATSPGHI
jgi:DNA-binding IclR family transcriptional regulator